MADRIKWHGDKLNTKLKGEMRRAFDRVGLLVAGDIKDSMLGQRGPAAGRYVSPEGEPPAIQTARLVGSITHELIPDGVRIGTNVEYAKRLELGYIGTDAKGRHIQQGPRPFMLPALVRNRNRIAKELARGAT